MARPPAIGPNKESNRMSTEGQDQAHTDTCPLPASAQRRNMILFAACTSTQYLAAPVLYVGITQASLCDRLGASVSTSNLPGTLFFAMTAVPALIAWASPKVSVLKRNLSLCYTVSAVMLAAISLVLALSTSNNLKIAMVVLQGGVTGAFMPAAIALLWEAVGRGVGESRRGTALSMGFGFGPIMAVIGSLAQTSLLGGDLFGLKFPGVEYPMNFVILFGAGVPIMLLAAAMAQFLVIPPVESEPERAPANTVLGLLIGLPLMFASVALIQAAQSASMELLKYAAYVAAFSAAACFIHHFREVLSQRVLLTATIVTILVYAGNVIPSNMNLYSREALGDLPEKFAGVQNTLRFSFKVVAGMLLGWILTKTNPRACIVTTASIFLSSQVWAMFVKGPWYLLASGIHGAGELVGVYAPNYIVSASRRDELRRNTAFMTMLMVPAAPAGYLYGAIVDYIKATNATIFGMDSTTFGFRLSFFVCSMIILSGIVLALFGLPAHPRPEPDAKTEPQ